MNISRVPSRAVFLNGWAAARVLLDWIGGLTNPDCNLFCWIGLWLAIQNQNRILDLDCQSSFCISIQIQKQSYFLSRNQKLMVNLAPAIKPSYFLSTFVLHLMSWLIKICLLGIPCQKHLCKILLMFAAFHFFSSSWIVIGFGLDCQSILKSGFGFGFKITFLCWIWIGLTIQKKLDWAKAWCYIYSLKKKC